MNKQEFTAGRSRAAGNLLIDLVIGVALLGLIAAMLAGTYSNLIQRSVDSFETTRATWMANSAMEVISGYPFADPVFVDGSIGLDGHESVMTTFDDIDDFDGYNFILESYPAYTVAVAVSWADISAEEIAEDVNPTFFKRIMVTAQNDMLRNPVSLTTIMSAAGSGVGGGSQIIAEEELNNSFDTAQRIPRTSFYATENLDVGDEAVFIIAGLAEHIINLAEKGNGIALSVVQEATHTVADYILALIDTLEYNKQNIVLAGNGSVIKNDFFRKSLNDELRFNFPQIKWTFSALSPAYGAGILAARLHDVEVKVSDILKGDMFVPS